MYSLSGKIFFILSITLIFSCIKDDIVPIEEPNPPMLNDCYDFEELIFSFFTRGQFQFQKPYLNPTNENEFVYQYINTSENEFQLKKYNLSTDNSVIIVDEVELLTQPSWSSAGWIAFDNIDDYEIWTTSESGDSLSQLTESPFNLFPSWNAEGNELLWQSSFNLGVPYFIVNQSIGSNLVDTTHEGFTRYHQISALDILAAEIYIDGEGHIGISPIDSIEFQSVFNLAAFDLMGNSYMTWDSTGQFIYFSVYNNSEADGLFRLDVNTGIHEKLIDYCESKRYDYLTCANSGNYLIAERVDSYLIEDTSGIPTGEIRLNSSIYKIDLNTLVETKIELE